MVSTASGLDGLAPWKVSSPVWRIKVNILFGSGAWSLWRSRFLLLYLISHHAELTDCTCSGGSLRPHVPTLDSLCSQIIPATPTGSNRKYLEPGTPNTSSQRKAPFRDTTAVCGCM